MPNEIILLSRSDIESLMPFGEYVDAVAEAFRLHAEGRAVSPAPLHIPAEGGGFHVKLASLPLGRRYVAIKTNSNFPQNRSLRDLPTVQGAILLLDADDGTLLAFLDSMEITLKRTGAATAVAGRYLARPDSRTATICGCGEQGRIQLAALRHVLDIKRVFAWDKDAADAAGFVGAMSKEHGIDVATASNLRAATLESDVIVTCTPSREPYLGLDDVRPGTFIAAVGADNPQKSEIHPELMARASVVTDILAQCATMGDLHHAISAGRMTPEAVHAELGDLVVGRRRGGGQGRMRSRSSTARDGHSGCRRRGTCFRACARSRRWYQVSVGLTDVAARQSGRILHSQSQKACKITTCEALYPYFRFRDREGYHWSLGCHSLDSSWSRLSSLS